MATEACMKADRLPKSDIKAPQATIIECPADDGPAVVPALEKPWMCTYGDAPSFKGELQKAKITGTFECEYPSVEPNVYRTRDPLPFPDSLHDLISWTDAFVDRIASMTQAEEKKKLSEFTRLTKKIEYISGLHATTAVDLDKSRTATKAAETRTTKAERDTTNAKSDSVARQKTIDSLEAEAKKNKEREAGLHRQIADLNKQLAEKISTLKKQQEAFTKASDKAARKFKEEHEEHMEDHDALDAAAKKFEEEQAKKSKVEQELAAEKVTVTNTRAALAASTAENKDLVSKINSLNTKIEDLTSTNDALNEKIVKLTTELADTNHNLDAAKTVIEGLNGDVTDAKKKIWHTEKELVAAKESIATLEGEKKTLASEKDSALADITTLKSTLLVLQDDKAKLTSQVANFEKSAAEAAAKKSALDAELTKLSDALLRAQDEKAAAIKERNMAEDKRDEAQDLVKQTNKKRREEEATHETEMEGLRITSRGKITQEQLDEVNTKLTKATADLSKAEAETKTLKEELAAVKKPINIVSVEYGKKNYTRAGDAAVFQRLQAAADGKKKFKADNVMFAPDPWVGTKKTCTIVYEVKTKKTLEADENDNVGFSY